MTHPFHPLCGQDFEFVAYRQNWGEDRVHLHDENGQLFSLPAGWTDAAAADPFVVVAAGRAPFTMAGLLALADLCVPKTSSRSCDQVIFVDQATDASVFSDAVLTEIDRFGERFQRRGAAQRAVRPVLIVATRGRTW